MCHIEDVVRIYLAIRTNRNQSIEISDVIDLLVHDTIESSPQWDKEFKNLF